MGGFSFQGYLQQNFEHCYVNQTVTITNNGIAGETTTQGLVRFPKAIEGRTGFMLILMGSNDAISITRKEMTIATTEKNMRYYIEESLKHNLIPIVGTIQFFNDKNDQFYKDCNLYVKSINAMYKKLAMEYHIHIADINRALGRDFSLYQDYVHPNDQGYRLVAYVWFDAVNQAIEEKLLLIGLSQNYPNPVRDNTTIGFSLSQAGRVTFQLYNMNGAEVKTLNDGYYSSGYHEFGISLTTFSPGMYIYVMQVGGQQLSKKLLLVK